MTPMRALLLTLLLAAVPALAAEQPRYTPGRDTLKNRLSDKASDEQRVNDCKVPPERRGKRERPTECPSASYHP
jgi:hypothetical protein